MNKEGLLIIISGFSGAGKGTVVKELVANYDYCVSISATTRKPRTGEEHGREYFFLTRDEFESMIENSELIEWAEYVGNYYGTPKKYVMDQRKAGHNVILEIEIQGALKVKEQFPDALLLFIVPPTAKELKDRLVNRGTEDMATIEKRMARACEESVYMDKYDYIVINDQVDECAKEIDKIVQSEKRKASYNLDFIDKMKQELNDISKGEQ